MNVLRSRCLSCADVAYQCSFSGAVVALLGAVAELAAAGTAADAAGEDAGMVRRRLCMGCGQGVHS